MSKRDKQWLITIQLSQLNTGTPYIDDYYYTVFKERKSKSKGERENKAHKDNQLNHPFSQPKGHAQLVIMSMGNKNGMNQRNGQNNRERKNSESNKDKEQTPRTYTPLQFENSLGKLQVNFERVRRGTALNGFSSKQKKILSILSTTVWKCHSTEKNHWHGRCGSRIVQSIYDVDWNICTKKIPSDINAHWNTVPHRVEIGGLGESNSHCDIFNCKGKFVTDQRAVNININLCLFWILSVRQERKEKERLAALEQQMLDNVINKEVISSLNLDSTGNSVRSSMSLTEKEDEGRDELLPKLIAGLTSEKVAHMMTVRKGKVNFH